MVGEGYASQEAGRVRPESIPARYNPTRERVDIGRLDRCPGFGVRGIASYCAWTASPTKVDLQAAGDPDRDFLLPAEEGLPVGMLEPLPRTPHVF